MFFDVTGFVELISITVEFILILSKKSFELITSETALSSESIVIITSEFFIASLIVSATTAPFLLSPSAFSLVLLKTESVYPPFKIF